MVTYCIFAILMRKHINKICLTQVHRLSQSLLTCACCTCLSPSAMVDNVCYVGFVEVGGDATTEEAPQGCASDAHNMSGLQERRTLSLEPFHIDDDLYAKPVKKAERKVTMDCSLGNQ
ncbi:uncharacterized protein LOC124264626 isoform X1 [Haliotis rubra]|uniref:uncharacterized protein LOC124264626 isoform X1 n=1 Tax=Haliotis rubra TaxID=36100 RepID=UPI001EE62665|nr:uncharacterized protein LOC124264626 isoform X1 [Haliotis rubra]